MKPSNSKDAALRRAVSERLRRFFGQLTTQLASGSAEIWNRVERRLAHKPERRAPDEIARSSTSSTASTPQPAQQQQSKAKPKEEP